MPVSFGTMPTSCYGDSHFANIQVYSGHAKSVVFRLIIIDKQNSCPVQEWNAQSHSTKRMILKREKNATNPMKILDHESQVSVSLCKGDVVKSLRFNSSGTSDNSKKYPLLLCCDNSVFTFLISAAGCHSVFLFGENMLPMLPPVRPGGNIHYWESILP